MKIINDDCINALKTLSDCSVDAIVTDPPYEIGFMNKKWDNTGIVYNIELWRECLRVLKPGGHMVVFSSTRTYHRMVVAIEDAGFEIKDMIEWIYSSGFPVSQNIGKIYDKKFGGTSCYEGQGTSLKPAHEPICLARKTIDKKTIVDNVMEYGTGGLGIDDCRIPTAELTPRNNKFGQNGWKNNSGGYVEPSPHGRFPANVICQDDALNDGELIKGTERTALKKGCKGSLGNFKGSSPDFIGHWPGDVGSKSKYFDLDIWAENYGIIQCPKPNRKEKNYGCDELINVKYTAGNYSQSPVCKTCNKTLNGTNDHSKCSGEVYYKEMKSKIIGNNHPTVKPLKLMAWLISLIAPTEGMIVLDPFTGSGTTGVACVSLGRDFIGIEKEKEYIPIIESRIKSAKKIKKSSIEIF